VIAYFVVGKLLTWAAMNAEPVDIIRRRSDYINRMLTCDFCTGTWVYMFLAFFFGFKRKSRDVLGIPYIPVLTEFIIGVGASLTMHLLRIGWETKFNAVRS
jgi:hypothetical protein